MRIEIYDPVGYCHTISSKNARTIGDWFAEHAAKVISADARMQSRMRIWPDDEDDLKILRERGRTFCFSQDDLLYLAEQILNASAEIGARE